MLVSLIVALLVFIIICYIINLAPVDTNLRRILWAIIVLFFLLWMVGLLTGHPVGNF